MSTTYHATEHRSRAIRRIAAALCSLVIAASALTACAPKTSSTPGETTSTAGDKTGYGMGGVNQRIVISKSVYDAYPSRWDLRTPDSAVRSYLAWVSYAYRIGESDVASPTQTPYQTVRTDAYVQMNLQKERLLDQTLDSITFGTPSKDGTHTLLPAKEKWTYRYVSIAVADKTLEGPYTASYETTYTLVKSKAGWQVDSIAVTALSEVK